MNLHQPLVEKKIQNRLKDAARMLKFLGADDWAEDLIQTAHSIQQDFDEARQQEKQERIDNN